MVAQTRALFANSGKRPDVAFSLASEKRREEWKPCTANPQCTIISPDIKDEERR
jgi:hypothetical protein